MLKLDLHEGWTVAPASTDHLPADFDASPVPATVPGCVHSDLMAAGRIDDPYVGMNETAVQWIGETDWVYRRTFDAPADAADHHAVELVCEGLDTVATVELNGEEVGRSENMHCTYRWDVKPLLKPAGNELSITFRSALAYAREHRDRLGDLPKAGNGSNPKHPGNFIRKEQCNFGWDWGPCLVTCGIWRPIRLEAWSGARIRSVRPVVIEANDARAVIDVHVGVEGGAAAVKAWIKDGPHAETAKDAEADEVTLRLTVEQPELWWPVGHGKQPLYELQVSLDDDRHAWTGRIGLRTVELDTTPVSSSDGDHRDGDPDDAHRFVLKVNGKPVFCKGANWIPDDVFPNRASDPAALKQRIDQALGANMNMLRIWGGGLYESAAFYDLCDELGVMVWQDFLFGCAAYPEEEPFWSLVEQEARDNISRLASHPSLVLWCGNNENFQGYTDWGWKESGALDGRTWGTGYYLDLLPKLLDELDPSRPYWPGSAYSGDWSDAGEPRANTGHRGDSHVWTAWFGHEYAVYRAMPSRFCSEFGFQAPATYGTTASAIDVHQLKPGTPEFEHRQRSPKGNTLNREHLLDYFEEPDLSTDAGVDDWLYLLQLNQARALTTGVNYYRSTFPYCNGTLYWQLNDCWPVTSWAAVDRGADGRSRRKPLWYATRRFYADRLLTFEPTGFQSLEEAKARAGEDGRPRFERNVPVTLHAHNDSDDAWAGELIVRRFTLAGEVLSERAVEVSIAPRSRVAVLEAPACDDPANELLVAELSGERALWTGEVDKHLRYPAPDFEASLDRGGDTHRLTIAAGSLLRDLCVFADRLHPAAGADDQLITLLPGESRVVTITSPEPLGLDALTAPPVLQCANRFGAR